MFIYCYSLIITINGDDIVDNTQNVYKSKQYFKIRKLSNEELNERRSLTAMSIAIQIEKGITPWQQSFDPKKDIEYKLPYDVIQQRFILGYNLIELIAKKSDNDKFCKRQYINLNDIKKNNYRVKKGSKSIPIELFLKYDISYPIDPKTKRWTFKMTKTKEFIAYNQAMFPITDLVGKYNFIDLDKEIEPTKFIGNLLDNTKVNLIEEKHLAESYYAPRRDQIHIGDKASYSDDRLYYSELLRHTIRSLTKPGRISEKGTEGFCKDKNDIRFLRDKFRVELATMQLCIMTKLPYKPTLSKLDNKKISYNFGYIPNYLVIVANDSYRLVNKALELGLNLKKEQSKIQKIDKDSFKEKIKNDLSSTSAKQENASIADFIKNTLSEGKYSNRKIIDLTLSKDFKELTDKDLNTKKDIVKKLIKDFSKQILSK